MPQLCDRVPAPKLYKLLEGVQQLPCTPDVREVTAVEQSHVEQCHAEQHSLPALVLKPITKYNLRLALVHCALRHRVHLCCVKTVHTPLSCQVEQTVGSIFLSCCPKEHSSYTKHSPLIARLY